MHPLDGSDSTNVIPQICLAVVCPLLHSNSHSYNYFDSLYLLSEPSPQMCLHMFIVPVVVAVQNSRALKLCTRGHICIQQAKVSIQLA